MSNYKVDIFKLLSAISNKNITFYQNLSEEEKKGFTPFIVARWLSGVNNKQQVYLLNAIVNPFSFEFGQYHKELLYYLLTICCPGKDQRYVWNKLPSKGNSSRPTTTQVVADYFNYSTKQAREALKILSLEDVLEYAEALGRQSDEMSKIKKEAKDNS